MLSERQVYFRKKNKLTQNDFAYSFNDVSSTNTNWEAGRSEPDVSTLIKHSDIYNVSLDNLVGRTYRMPPQFEGILDQISDIDTEPKKKALNL
ncbi:helix-turn-helix domain-containing protein, partial [Bacillus cereus]|uniref:helix-turn-helix domain-containing protein n=1 Tax=Bacillus cereus TaxID=1396 RepID=UPI002112822C|nr:helix-turn-helix transcriptional regulator [Bacillus cereus]